MGAAKSEIRDGMRIDWDVADRDGRRPRAARRRVPASRRRALPGDPYLRPLRQGPRVPGRLPERLGAHGRRASRRRCRLDQQVPELGGGRPGEVGARRLRLRARRFARRRPLARSTSIISRRARRATSTTASSGPARSPGAAARSASTASPTTRINQWQVASLQPPHLAAMCIWEGVGRLVSRHDPPRRHPVARSGPTGTTCR